MTSNSSTPASINSETGRGHGLSLIFWLLEQPGWKILSIPTVVALVGVLAALAAGLGGIWLAVAFIATWLAVPLFFIVIPIIGLIMASRGHDDGATDWDAYLDFKDAGLAAAWKGKKIPMEVVYHSYMDGKLDFKQDVYETFLKRNGLFRFCFTWNDIWFYARTFIAQNLGHTIKADEGDIAHVYNRGNDFYNWFLGETMIYTSGIFRDRNESLEEGQRRKLDTVCQYVQMKPGDRHLDIGCGWGTLISWSAKHYGAESTGITLAKEQAEWGRATAEREGVSDKVRIIVDDYRKLPSEKWDKITCLEMAEHVGIKNFQKFLLQVRHMLKDDGIFYLQIAGLRRPWQFEDLVWGLFMGKYIFPGADASAPLGFVVNQCERAGWEVHRVENCGVHYSLTIHKWYENWKKNEAAIVEKYGRWWFRLWMVFLAWSTIIAAQGSSTVFMITLTKNETNDKDSVDAETAKKVSMNRMQKWVGPKPVATQQ